MADQSSSRSQLVRPPFLIALVITVIAGAGFGWYWYQKWQAPSEPTLSADMLSNLTSQGTAQPRVPRFSLTDQAGQTFDTIDTRGRYLILTFGSTHADDDRTPIVAENLAQLQERLTEDLEDEVFLLLITNRPSTDTPEAFAALADTVGADPETWRLLSAPGDGRKAAGINTLAREILRLPAPRSRTTATGTGSDMGDDVNSDERGASSDPDASDPDEGTSDTASSAPEVIEPIVDPGTVILTDANGRVLNWFGGLAPREMESLERNLREHREAVRSGEITPTSPDADDTSPSEAAPSRRPNQPRGFPFPFGGGG